MPQRRKSSKFCGPRNFNFLPSKTKLYGSLGDVIYMERSKFCERRSIVHRLCRVSRSSLCFPLEQRTEIGPFQKIGYYPYSWFHLLSLVLSWLYYLLSPQWTCLHLCYSYLWISRNNPTIVPTYTFYCPVMNSFFPFTYYKWNVKPYECVLSPLNLVIECTR